SPIGIEPPRSNCSSLGCEGPPSFVLWGDSHAMVIASLCDELARSKGLSGQCFGASGITPLLNAWNDHRQTRQIQLDWNRRVVDWIKSNKVPNVIIVSRWEMAVPSPLIDWRHWRGGDRMDEDTRQGFENLRLSYVLQDHHSLRVSNEDAHRV